MPGDYDPSHRSLQRYGASLSRSMPLTSGAVARVEGAVMAGTGLDRFSRYSFGTFDNRLRGYPSALIRYDRGAVLRGAVAWPITTFARLDGFVDTAYVRDRGFGTGYRNYTGIGRGDRNPGAVRVADLGRVGLRVQRGERRRRARHARHSRLGIQGVLSVRGTRCVVRLRCW